MSCFMTNETILETALEQSAEDIGCRPEDFLSDKNIIVPFRMGENARKYYKKPIACNLVSYGSNVVAAVTEEVSDIVGETMNLDKGTMEAFVVNVVDHTVHPHAVVLIPILVLLQVVQEGLVGIVKVGIAAADLGLLYTLCQFLLYFGCTNLSAANND